MPEIREHIADGIEEYDNPLPRWWINLFYLTIVFAVGYMLWFPSVPGYIGLSEWTSNGNWEQQMAEAVRLHPELAAADTPADLEALSHNTAMVAQGREIFAARCAVCHGEAAEGNIGPCLWGPKFRFGGDSKTMLKTIREGRPGGMPTWKKFLPPDKILEVAAFVYSLRYQKHDRPAQSDDSYDTSKKAGPQS